jgi:hypothetical protein
LETLSLHPSDAVQGFGISQQVFCNAKQADVYTSALLAGAMKPLKVLSKFENYFLIRTVSFQVHLGAGGYFLLRRFLRLHLQQAGIQHKNTLVPHLNGR